MSGNSIHPFSANINYLRKSYTAFETAGTEVDDVANVEGRAKIAFLSFIFTTNATVASRSIQIGVEVAGTFIALGGTVHPIPANDVFKYYCYPGAPVEITTSQLSRYIPLPNLYSVLKEDRVQTLTDNLQAGDQFTEISIWLECQPSAKLT